MGSGFSRNGCFLLESGLGPELLGAAEMYAADAAAVDRGLTPDLLMEAAGRAVAEVVAREYPTGAASILCGPGNNGGDGYVIARWLRKFGWRVRVGQLGPAPSRAEAGRAVRRWAGASAPAREIAETATGIVVDALFGAGLNRLLEGDAADVVDGVNASRKPVIAVDIPSGVDGSTGAVMGSAIQAARTVTFFRAKPGHCLLPGRAHCGTVSVHDIGIPDCVLAKVTPTAQLNDPDGWSLALRFPEPGDHKHQRGAILIVGGRHMTGAARLAGRAARRIGAGLLTLAAPPECFAIYAMDQPGAVPIASAPTDLAKILASRRFAGLLVGPGLGVSETTRNQVLTCLAQPCPVVVDADGLSSFQDNPEVLLAALRAHGQGVLTPHDGEFTRIFTASGTKIARATQAARDSHAVVIFKGYDTVIAAPDGRARVNVNAPATLATAGSGDVLAGMVVGLVGQGMAPFDAACAAVWMHGAAAETHGLGLVAEDLVDRVPTVLRRLATAWETGAGR